MLRKINAEDRSVGEEKKRKKERNRTPGSSFEISRSAAASTASAQVWEVLAWLWLPAWGGVGG